MICIFLTDSLVPDLSVSPKRHAATWIDLEIVILREVNQTEKETYHTSSLICRI